MSIRLLPFSSNIENFESIFNRVIDMHTFTIIKSNGTRKRVSLVSFSQFKDILQRTEHGYYDEVISSFYKDVNLGICHLVLLQYFSTNFTFESYRPFISAHKLTVVSKGLNNGVRTKQTFKLAISGITF